MFFWYHNGSGWRRGGLPSGLITVFLVFLVLAIVTGGRFPWWLIFMPFWFGGPAAWRWFQGEADSTQAGTSYDEAEAEKRKRDFFYDDEGDDEKAKRTPEYISTPDGEVIEVVDAPPHEASRHFS